MKGPCSKLPDHLRANPKSFLTCQIPIYPEDSNHCRCFDGSLAMHSGHLIVALSFLSLGALFFGEEVNRHSRQNDQKNQRDLYQGVRTEAVDQCLEFQDPVNQQDQEREPADAEYRRELEFSFLQFHTCILAYFVQSQESGIPFATWPCKYSKSEEFDKCHHGSCGEHQS